jgi:phosphoribosylaminoimidazole-succinocarboxamide synthase
MPEEVRKYKDQLEDRAMLVKKAKVIPLEAIVRGYLTGGHNYPITGSFLTSNS